MEQPNLHGLGFVPTPATTDAGARSKQPTHGAESGGPAFQAILGELLERVQSQTKRITETSKTLEDPRGLPDALGVARDSLDDAVRLGDRLLEAYREARQQGHEGDAPDQAHDDGHTNQGDESWK